MKDIGFLNNLKKEAINAINGEGKSLSAVKKMCSVAYVFLNKIENNREVTFDSSDKKTIVLDLDLADSDPEDLKFFKEIIYDLEGKVIVHKEDLKPKKDFSIFQDTHTLREIQKGKSMVLIDTGMFRQYKNELKKIMDDIEKEERIRILEDSSNPADILSKRVRLPKVNPVFTYDTKNITFLNGKRSIVLDTITGLAKTLLVYFINNPDVPLTERRIEENLEFFLRNTESRGDRATYTAITKLNAELKRRTKRKFLTKIKDIYENIWIFSIKN